MKLVELSNAQKTQIKEIFDLFDTDGGGSIDCREKDAALFALGFQPTFSQHGSQSGSSSLDTAIKSHRSTSVDPTGPASQTITLSEFTTLMKGEQVVLNPMDAIWAAFIELSGGCHEHENPDVTVTVEGLKRACCEYDVKLSEDELHQLIDELDVNGDGSVDKGEFMRLMRLAPWF